MESIKLWLVVIVILTLLSLTPAINGEQIGDVIIKRDKSHRSLNYNYDFGNNGDLRRAKPIERIPIADNKRPLKKLRLRYGKGQ